MLLLKDKTLPVEAELGMLFSLRPFQLLPPFFFMELHCYPWFLEKLNKEGHNKQAPGIQHDFKTGALTYQGVLSASMFPSGILCGPFLKQLYLSLPIPRRTLMRLPLYRGGS